MGRMLQALKQLDDRADSPRRDRSAATTPPADDRAADHEASRQPVQSAQHEPIDPRYREVIGAILSQLAVRSETTLLVAGFRDDEPRGGQLAALYPLLANQVDGGIVVLDAAGLSGGLAERFELYGGLGLDDALAGRATWQDVVRETRYDRLHVVPGANREDSHVAPGETKRSKTRTTAATSPNDLLPLLSELTRASRLVVVDNVLTTPEEMAAWSTVCDAVVLAVRLETTPRRQVRQAIHAIRARGGQILGCVLLEP